ncbi:MAG TPA: ABC transporter substrate-binding protein [Candidatus Elarobacter sp.]|nr:ABC transporter substrate-binding protein [Candidatus Elarobacter sp.]
MKRPAFLAMLGAAALPACGSARRPFRVGADTFEATLDPYAVSAHDVDDYAWIYGDGLTGGERVPSAMLSAVPEARDGGLTVRYRLRAIRWHDGARLHARHVVEAVDRLRHPPGAGAPSPWLTYEPYASIADLAARGGDTVDVRLRRPQPQFERTFFSPYGHPALPLLRHDADGRPIGTGPFRLEHADTTRWRFSAWRGSPRGFPASAKLDVFFRPSTEGLANAIAGGEVDLAVPLAVAKPTATSYRLVSRDESSVVLLFNCEGAFHTAALRLAALRALDLGALQNVVNPAGRGRIAGILPATAPDDVAFSFPPRDIAAARAVLRGVRGPVTIVHPSRKARYATVALLVQQMLEAAGLAVRIVPRPIAAYFTPEGPLRTGRFDLVIYGFQYTDEPDLAADWSCANKPPHGANYARFCDRAFDAALAAGHRRDALRIVLHDAAVVPLAPGLQPFGVGLRVRGFSVPPRFVPPTLGVQRWIVPGETD